MNYNDQLEVLFKKLMSNEIDEKSISIIEDILRGRLNREISFRDRKDIERYLDDITSEWNKERGNYNLIPSDITGPCQTHCVAIASNSFDGKRIGLNSGFKGLMLNLAAYWFGCYHTTKTTIILTNDWNSKKFNELYKNIIDNYTKVHGKKVIIIEIDPAGLFLRYPF